MTKIKEKNIKIFMSSKNLKNLKPYVEPFACMLVSFKPTNQKEKEDIAKIIIDKGCHFIVCGEKECEEWEDVFDKVFLEKYNYEPPANYNFFTTSHKGEKANEVVSYFFLNTAYGVDKKTFSDYLILFIGDNKSKKEMYLKEIKRFGDKNE